MKLNLPLISINKKDKPIIYTQIAIGLLITFLMFSNPESIVREDRDHFLGSHPNLLEVMWMSLNFALLVLFWLDIVAVFILLISACVHFIARYLYKGLVLFPRYLKYYGLLLLSCASFLLMTLILSFTIGIILWLTV